MFNYVPLNEQVRKTEKENNILKQQLEKSQADISYIAMMTDVNIDDEEADSNE